MRLLLIEDDKMLADALRQALHDARHAVDWVEDGLSALDAARSHAYDAVLLDLSLPEMSGIDVLRELRRSQCAVALIIITARDSVEDRVGGLDLGADDYIVKPFDVDELLARLRAVVRRKSGAAQPVLSNGVVSLDPSTFEASVEGRVAVLSPREFSLLHALLQKPGMILSRHILEEKIYGWNEEVESNAVEFLIYGVRRKLGSEAIKNVRGLGWTVPRAKT
ncbi:MAG: response regulator transcription factor [Reyranella sp.]|nr:response regulator transcription factor [Reyranella sp.]